MWAGHHDNPNKITSGNVSRFISLEFQNFLSSYGVYHHTCSMTQASGLVECLDNTLLKTAKCATIGGKYWCDSLIDLLVVYPATPLCMTGITPARNTC